jgi:hypothetical protein
MAPILIIVIFNELHMSIHFFKTKFALVIAGLLFSGAIFAQTAPIQTLNLTGIGWYRFQPNVPININNPLFFSVTAHCKITTAGTNQTLFGEMTKGNGELNGKKVGSGLDVVLNNNSILKIKASGYATVKITNKGTTDIIASCSLGTSDRQDFLLSH